MSFLMLQAGIQKELGTFLGTTGGDQAVKDSRLCPWPLW